VVAERRPRYGRWVLLLVVIVAAGFGWQQWQQWNRQQITAQQTNAWQRDADALNDRIEDLAVALDRLARNQKSIETRAGDNAATNRVLREELLGMGERAALLEDAIGRMADTRLRGEVVMRLNEAEFLLLLGQERLRLFGDAAATIQAYAMADAVLSGLEDPLLATSRQVLSQELAALREVQEDTRPQIRAVLSNLAAALSELPAPGNENLVEAQSNDSRLVKLMSQLVTVRRVADRDAALGTIERDTGLELLRLQLQLAQSALSRPDPLAYRNALQQVDASMQRLFDPTAAKVIEWRERLSQLQQVTLTPDLPVLGATLLELRSVRAMRNANDAASAPRAEPAPVAAPDSDPATEEPIEDSAGDADADAGAGE
jgi:uroporphyrin-3 C-methyltransferase